MMMLNDAKYKRVTLAIFILLSGWLSYTAHELERSIEEAERAEANAGLVNVAAPTFSVPLLVGQDGSTDGEGKREVSLAEMEGKVLIISFWASWCRPCDYELPLLNQFYRNNQIRGVEVIAISLDHDPEEALKYAQGREYDFPMAWDATGQVDEMYQIEVLPTLVVIGPDGIVHERHEGVSMHLESMLSRWVSELSPAEGGGDG